MQGSTVGPQVFKFQKTDRSTVDMSKLIFSLISFLLRGSVNPSDNFCGGRWRAAESDAGRGAKPKPESVAATSGGGDGKAACWGVAVRACHFIGMVSTAISDGTKKIRLVNTGARAFGRWFGLDERIDSRGRCVLLFNTRRYEHRC